MSSFVPPTAEIPVSLVTTYSVAGALIVNAIGFVVASFHYSRLGVTARHLSLQKVWGAGLSFSVLTVLYFHIGFASHHLLQSTRPSESFWYLGVGVFFYWLMAMFFVRRPGVQTYIAACALIGGGIDAGFVRTDYVPAISVTAITVAWPAVVFVTLLCFVWAYTVMVYPNLAAALGGAAPHPVRLAVQTGYEELIPTGSRVYEMLGTDAALFVEIAIPEGTPHKPRGDMFWFRRFDPPAIYLQLPRSAIKCIEYTDTFDLAPAVNAEICISEGERAGESQKKQRSNAVYALIAAVAGVVSQAPVSLWTRVAFVSGCVLVSLLVYRRRRRNSP